MVSRSSVLTPKHPRTLQITAAVSAGMLLVWLIGTWLWAFSPKRGLGLLFGIVASLAFVFEMVYPVGRARPGPLRTAKVWLQAHVYLGAVAFLAVLAHSGFSWPHGGMGLWLLGLSFWTTATGLLGVWLQKWIPSAMAQGLKVEALCERIPSLVDGLRAEADALVDGSSETLQSFYAREIRPLLERPNPSWSYVLDVRSGRDRLLTPCGRIRDFVSVEERDRLSDLVSILIEKLELDAQYRLQWLLRSWLLLHVPPAGLLMGLLTVHVFTWLRY